MESISQRVPQGERGPYRWGRGGPLYGDQQGGRVDQQGGAAGDLQGGKEAPKTCQADPAN